MMHKGVGTPPISCLAGPDKKISRNIPGARVAQAVGSSEGGLKPRLCTPTHSPRDTRPRCQYA